VGHVLTTALSGSRFSSLRLCRRFGDLTHPNNPPRENQKIISHSQISFSGPIPPPELLSKYGEIIPNGADRILKMAENQSTHRQCIEKWAVIGGTILSYFGVLCAGIIALGTLYFGSQLIREGHVISGSVFGGGGLVGLVTAFIYGTRARREERLRRDQQNRELIGPK
jgi:uncharacterized membrane protein